MAGEFRFGRAYLALGIACFAVLGGLTGRHVRPDAIHVLVFGLGGALFALAGLALLDRLLGLLSARVRQQHGQAAVLFAVGRGYLMVLPFTALALMAELYLGWNAVQPFTAAGMTTAGASVGMEMVKLGGGRIVSLAVPTGAAFALSALWMVLSAVAQGAWR